MATLRQLKKNETENHKNQEHVIGQYYQYPLYFVVFARAFPVGRKWQKMAEKRWLRPSAEMASGRRPEVT